MWKIIRGDSLSLSPRYQPELPFQATANVIATEACFPSHGQRGDGAKWLIEIMICLRCGDA